jgi:hypothetical protein
VPGGELCNARLFSSRDERFPPQDPADGACFGFPAFQERIERVAKEHREGDADLGDLIFLNKFICRADGIFPVSGNSFINGYCGEPDPVKGWQEPGEDHQECGAVLSPAQANADMVARLDHLPGPDRLRHA